LDLHADLVAYQGGRPPQQWAQAEPQTYDWGSVTVSFTGCDQAQMSWTSADPAFGTGNLELVRFSLLQGQRCQAQEIFSQQISYGFERRSQGFEAVFADLPAAHDPEFYE